ncbi:high light inducible protein [Prochlorococcus sp. MIT 0916]
MLNSAAELFNALIAMLGIVAGLGAYATTGQFIAGIF